MLYFGYMRKIPSTPIELEIRKLGLSEKEAKVYLACLELDDVTVQNIAKKTGLSRPTTYRVLESLKDKGLINKFSQKSKGIIVRSPDEILGMLRAEIRQVEEKEREFIRIISRLKSKYAGSGKNEIKIYSGKEGEKFLLEDLATTHSPDIWAVFSVYDKNFSAELEEIYKKIKNRLGMIAVKEIYSQKPEKSESNFIQRKFIPHSIISSGKIIIADKFIYFDDDRIFTIEQFDIINLFRSFINAFWNRQ
jgi:sugar-specific transcriptional regulator TrmB